MKRLVGFFILIFMLAFQGIALAGSSYTLHPSGFGEHSYSAWKAGEGLPDSSGNSNQALYFQKMTLTLTNAAGVAVIKGFEGQPVSALAPLSFYWRKDGHCGAGAPRFNIRYNDQLTGMEQTYFIGCQGMVPTDQQTDNYGRQWEQRTYGGFLPAGTIVSVAIVFDEGNDIGQGFVYLDNIQVGQHVWTSASDNSNNEVIVSSSEPLDQLLGEPISVALGQ